MESLETAFFFFYYFFFFNYSHGLYCRFYKYLYKKTEKRALKEVLFYLVVEYVT